MAPNHWLKYLFTAIICRRHPVMDCALGIFVFFLVHVTPGQLKVQIRNARWDQFGDRFAATNTSQL